MDWKRDFDLALSEVNASGGIGGRPVQTDFQDTQSDPRQAVAMAQRFVRDPRIVIELGDFSSAASMAASPIYQRGQAGAVRLRSEQPRRNSESAYRTQPRNGMKTLFS